MTGSRAIGLLALIAGGALFVHVVRQAGPTELVARLRDIGPGFLLVLAVSSSRYLTRALAWLYCLPAEHRRVGFGTLWRARVASEAVGDLSFGPLVAEPLKVASIPGRLPAPAAIASLAAENLAYAFGSGVMVTAGTLALLTRPALAAPWRAALAVALTAEILLLLGAASLVRWRWKTLSRRGAGGSRPQGGPGSRRVATLLAWLHALEGEALALGPRPRTTVAVVALSQIAFHLGGVLEAYVVLSLAGYGPSWEAAFVLESTNRALNIAFVFLPGLVGVDEAGGGWVADVVGLGTAAGVSLALVRKLRMLSWVAVGLALLASGQGTRAASPADSSMD